MDDHEARRRAGALKAIIQTMIHELSWGAAGARGREALFEMAEDGDPLSMAIVNELSRSEIDEAFGWAAGGDGSIESELRAIPVMAHLTREQRERVRASRVAEHEVDEARAGAVRGPGPCAARERVGEELFVAAMARHLDEHRGEACGPVAGGTVNETVDAMPAPWRSRTRSGLAALRDQIRAALEDDDGRM